MKTSLLLSGLLISMAGLSAAAQDLKPEIVMPSPGNSVIISKISNNGKWGVSQSASVTDGDLRPIGGTLFNLETLEQVPIHHPTGLAGVSDVTDDGSIVVGECDGKPAYWTRATESWTVLPLSGGHDIGRLNAVTTDGKIGVGYLSESMDGAKAWPVCYDLTTNKIIDLPNVPYLDMTNEDQKQNVFFDISPDGRFIAGQMSMSYVYPASLCSYVYDRSDDTFDIIGFTPNYKGKWIPDIPETFFIGSPYMSPNGQWITGMAYMVSEIPGSEWPREAYHTFRYNILEKKIEIYNDEADADIGGFAITNDGTVLAATPAENPYPSAVVRHGNYFIWLDQILKQVYGIDFQAVSGFDSTGKVLEVSDDGLTMLVLPNTTDTYLLRLKEPITVAAAKVNMLADYTVAPSEGVALSSLSSITLTFDRNVKINGSFSKIKFESTDGSQSFSPVSGNGCVANGNKVTITFRTRELKAGTDYTLTIPAGQISLANDESIKSGEIKIGYKGRGKESVKIVNVAPESGSDLNSLDLTTNPIVVTFDTEVKLAENASGLLYQVGLEQPISSIGILANKNAILLYPSVAQYLYKDTDYRVEIPAGVVTDISGNGPSEAFSLEYHGIYERTVDINDKVMFSSQCDDYADFLFYEGDHRTPDSVVAQWGFTADNTPWLIVRDSNESVDMALASHSMYNPYGKADDWMVIPQLTIPDSNCYLEFDAQSYLAGTDDDLHVYIYECEQAYGILTDDVIADFRENAKLVFDETLECGASEENMAGEWKKYNIDLSEYAGKSIYIAFVNENDDQSAIFIDNVVVIHDLPFLTTVKTPKHVVNIDSTPVVGSVVFADPTNEYSSIKIELKDAEGNTIDTIEESGLALKNGDIYSFEFKKPLPLVPGTVTDYSIATTANDLTLSVSNQVRDLTFQPDRKVVLEEYTGSECGNCPAGIRGIENIQSLYPGILIPITLRTYQNDVLGVGMAPYTQFLGLDQIGAPSGSINRKWAGYPMISHENDYRFSGEGIINPLTNKDEECWLDAFRKEIAEPAELGVQIKSSIAENGNEVNVTAKISSALNLDRTAYNIFAVITENGLTTYQANYYASSTDPDFGEWGYGGKYAQATVFPVVFNDVARGTFGLTYQGTSGLIPSKLDADKEYSANFTMAIPASVQNKDNCDIVVMVIDTATGNILNANITTLNGESSDSGVDDILNPADSGIGIAVVDGRLLVNADGRFTAAAYDMAGVNVASRSAEGFAEIPLNGFNGVLLVNVSDENGNVRSAKFIVR